MSWQIENNKLTKQFSFNSLTQLAEFLQIIAVQADKVDHHPDVTIFKAKEMKIELMSHDKNAITERDHSLAAFIDDAYDLFMARGN